MIMTITYVLSFLVALNFILIFVSCNKTPKNKAIKKPPIIKKEKSLIITKKLVSDQLDPTGS